MMAAGGVASTSANVFARHASRKLLPCEFMTDEAQEPAQPTICPASAMTKGTSLRAPSSGFRIYKLYGLTHKVH